MLTNHSLCPNNLQYTQDRLSGRVLRPLEAWHAVFTTNVVHVGSNAQPLIHLDSLPWNCVNPATWRLFVYVVQNLGFRVANVPFSKVRRVQSSGQITL